MNNRSITGLGRMVKRLLLGGAVLATAAVYTNNLYAEGSPAQAAVADAPGVLTVHKSPSCGCCGDWVDHMEESGFDTKINDTHDLNAVKQRHGIDPRYQSCHTTVSSDGQYFFEGHIPAKLVKQFLREQPEGAAGLAVPGMPLGSPGMEMGGRFQPYDVVQINKDGSVERYARIEGKQQQHAH